MLIEATNTGQRPITRGKHTFQRGETRTVEVAGTDLRELRAASSLKVRNVAAEYLPAAPASLGSADKDQARADELHKQMKEASTEVAELQAQLDGLQDEVQNAADRDEQARREAALAGENATAVKPTAPDAENHLQDLHYQLWAARRREAEYRRDYHLARVCVSGDGDRGITRKLHEAQEKVSGWSRELERLRIAARKSGNASRKEESAAERAASELAELERSGAEV